MDIHSMIKPVIDVKDTVVPKSDEGWVPMDEDGLAFVKPLWTSPESGGWEQVEGIRQAAAAA